MRWVRDLTGRFPQRPHYDERELDRECEDIIERFLRKRRGTVRYPLTTDDLTVLLEQDVEDLDLYADLNQEGADVQGVTHFSHTGKPHVCIAKELLEQPWRAHRLRTTLIHEYGHVHFHAFLWQFDPGVQHRERGSGPCQEAGILLAPQTDWMEWQAGYACAAFLMPLTAVQELVGITRSPGEATFTPLGPETPEGQTLIARVADAFDVSSEAAKVRLSRLHYLVSLPAASRLPSR